MNTLIQYGWSHLHNEYYKHCLVREALPGRVVSIKGFRFQLMTEIGEKEAELSGKVLFGTKGSSLPVVGDWVLFLDYDTSGFIVDFLPRTSALVRRAPGTESQTQVLAANVDTALIVQGLDRDFNPRRLERYIVQVTACGITPMIILNKADLVADPEKYAAEIKALQRDCRTFICSAVNNTGIDAIKEQALERGKTSILVGSSGAGKSSLLNALINTNVQKTGAVSSFNQKGKHTTATRDLFMLDNGTLIIDSPGMREFGLTSGESLSSAGLFPALAAFENDCRFSDCTHTSEASCAVRDAVARGALNQEVYDSYLKLLREQRHFEMSAADKKRAGKRGGKMAREAKEFKRRYKGG